jgi:hypothetical protein
MVDVEIPNWVDDIAPGAAEAVRFYVSRIGLSDVQRRRLARLVGPHTKHAWQELRRRLGSKKVLTPEELHWAQFQLLLTAFRAADNLPTSKRKIARMKMPLEEAGALAAELVTSIGQLADDPQVWGMWGRYWNRLSAEGEPLSLPRDLRDVANELKGLTKFFDRAVPLYKPQGSAPVVRYPFGSAGLRTAVIRTIARECKDKFGLHMHSVVAALANASLGNANITDDVVRQSLRRAHD